MHFPTNPENYLSFCDLTEVVLHPERKMWHTFVMQDQTDVLENLHGMIKLCFQLLTVIFFTYEFFPLNEVEA